MRCLVVLWLPLLAFGQPAGSAYLLRGGTIHTISGPVIENGSILIRDGKIVGVGRNLAAPEGVETIDVTGQQVYPGMIDSGSLLEPGDGAEGGDLNPQLRAASVVNPAAEQMEAARFNGVTSAVAVPEGDLISGQLSLPNQASLAIHLRFPAIVTAPVAAHDAEQDDEEPKTAVEPERIPYSEAKAIYDTKMRELNAFFDDARRYWKAKNRGKDLKFEAMIPVFEGKTPMFVTAVKEQEIREAIAFAEKERIRIILADAYEAYKALDAIKAHGIAVVLGPTMSLPLDRDDDYDRSFTTPGELYKAGIKFSIASFSATGSRNLPYQAAAAVPYGLPHDEAYKAISLNAAEIFGVSKRLGSIDEGKTADLIVTDGDPMEAMTNVKRVFIDGRPVDLESRQKRLYEKYVAR